VDILTGSRPPAEWQSSIQVEREKVALPGGSTVFPMSAPTQIEREHYARLSVGRLPGSQMGGHPKPAPACPSAPAGRGYSRRPARFIVHAIASSIPGTHTRRPFDGAR